jgi:hypothetical protein
MLHLWDNERATMTHELVGQNVRFLMGEPWNFHQFVDPKKCIGEVTSVIKGAPDDWITVKWEFEWESQRGTWATRI